MIQRRSWLRLCGRAGLLFIVISFPILCESKPAAPAPLFKP
jgi:hypothetical protein